MLFGGGFASDFGPSADVVPNQSGDVVFPFLVDAENVSFELDGGVRKIGGTTKLNSSVIASGAEIMGLADFWRMGTGGSGTQRRVVHAGTVIMADAADGTFANIRTGRTEDAIPSYFTIDDQLITALQMFGDKAFVEKLISAVGPAAVAAGVTSIDLFAQIFKGTPFEKVLDALATRPFAVVAGKGKEAHAAS